MPHQRCAGCGVISYAPVNGAGASCPECGVPWPSTDRRPPDDGRREQRITDLLRMTRELLDADVATLDEIGAERETVLLAAGEWPGAGSLQGVSTPLRDTICHQMLQGSIGHHVADVRADERFASLPMVRTLDIGAWLGVPITLSDARVYVLCCLAMEARPSLGAREVKLLLGLAESVRAQLLPATPPDA